MQIWTIVPMIIGIVAALFGMNKQKQGAPWGQPLAILGAIIAIASAIFSFGHQLTGGSNTSAIQNREQRFMFLKGKFLGEAIKKAVPGAKKIVVLVDPMEIYDATGEKLAEPRENFTVNGMKSALPGVEFVPVSKEIPKMKPATMKGPNGEEMEMPMMVDIQMTGRDFQKILPKIKGADVFVAVTMLPMDLRLKQVLGALKDTKAKVAILESGNTDAFKECFADGGKSVAELIAVAVLVGALDFCFSKLFLWLADVL